MIRRNFVSAALASILAPLGLCRRATAGPTPDDLAAMERGTLKPVEPPRYFYRAVARLQDGTIVLESSARESEGYVRTFMAGYCEGRLGGQSGTVEIQRCPVGEWETIEAR